MALLAALGRYSLQINGFRNRDLRGLIGPLLGTDYTAGQMTYDLRRLRRRGLITRLPGTHRYYVTELGLRVAYIFTKLSQRLLQPGWAALLPTATMPPPIQRAIRTLDRHLDQLLDRARLTEAA
jgi:hypothetical protein